MKEWGLESFVTRDWLHPGIAAKKKQDMGKDATILNNNNNKIVSNNN